MSSHTHTCTLAVPKTMITLAGRRAFERQQQLNAIFGCASQETWGLVQSLFHAFER